MHPRVCTRIGVDHEVDREVAFEVVDRDDETGADAGPVVGSEPVRVEQHDVADDGIAAEHVHVDVEAEDVELVGQAFDPAAMAQPDAGSLVECTNDLHKVVLTPCFRHPSGCR